MPITAVDFPTVRRIEAVGFRCFPAQSNIFDGSWAIRLTPHHCAKRLNSVNPLDPGDDKAINGRVERICDKFLLHERNPTFKLSPLAPKKLLDYLDDTGWHTIDETRVMARNLKSGDFEKTNDLITFKDPKRWSDNFLELSEAAPKRAVGMVQVMNNIVANNGLFMINNVNGEPIATVRCVQMGELAGIFDLVTSNRYRGKGYGKAILMSALKWAYLHGARRAWLQVVNDNEIANVFYEKLGFEELYRYQYKVRELPRS